MAGKQYPEFRLDSFNLINFLFRNWKIFLITGVLTFVISAFISLAITPLYKSSVILYPASNISLPGSALFEAGSNIATFGDEEATEKVLQILQSQSIKDRLIEEYDLFQHYDIDPDTKYRYTVMGNKLAKMISFRKTRFMSVEISVLDKEATIAADMANDIAAMVDKSFNNILREAGKKQVLVLESQYRQQADLVKVYEDSISKTGSSSITGYRSAIGGQGISISPYSPELMRFTAAHEQALEDLGTIRQRLTEAEMAASEDQAYTLVVNEARPSEMKAMPKRSVIVVVSCISTLLFLMLLLIFVEGIKSGSKKD